MLRKSNQVVADKGCESAVAAHPQRASHSTGTQRCPEALLRPLETLHRADLPAAAPVYEFSLKDDNRAWRQRDLTKEEQDSADNPLFLMPSSGVSFISGPITAQSLEIVTVVTSHPLSTFM